VGERIGSAEGIDADRIGGGRNGTRRRGHGTAGGEENEKNAGEEEPGGHRFIVHAGSPEGEL